MGKGFGQGDVGDFGAGRRPRQDFGQGGVWRQGRRGRYNWGKERYRYDHYHCH